MAILVRVILFLLIRIRHLSSFLGRLAWLLTYNVLIQAFNDSRDNHLALHDFLRGLRRPGVLAYPCHVLFCPVHPHDEETDPVSAFCHVHLNPSLY